MRKQCSLNFDWLYKADFKEEYLSTKDFSSFTKVNIPHTNIELPYNNFDERMYQFVSAYVKVLVVSSEYKDKNINLNFGAVMTYAEVYINGKLIGSHKGGYTPFSFNINEYVNYDEENIILVKVDSRELKDIPPFGLVVDYLTYGGIYREVDLLITDKMYINKAFLSYVDNMLKVRLDIVNGNENLSSINCKIRNGNDIIYDVLINESFNQFEFDVKDIILWDIDNPQLYDIEISLISNNEVVDTFNTKYGFRTVEFKEDGFYLNNKKIKLLGLNRHQSYPYVGYAMPKSAQERDADILKYELGVNIVRTSHYPQSVHFLNRCDEIGLLVFTEIPGWQHIGDDVWKQIVLQNVQEMIERDYNHPSVMMWGVRINESSDDNELYQKTNELAHQLDPYRPTGGVRNLKGSSFFEDCYTYNDFVHRGYNMPLENAKAVTKKNVPYLVTEHNGHMYPTKKFDIECNRIEHALRHSRVINTMMGNDSISGSIGWCMFDYNTHKDFGSGDKICYHGVLDMFRIPKLAAAAYSSQQDIYPYLELTTNMNIGDSSASEIKNIFVYTNCDYVDLYKNDYFIKRYYPISADFKYLKYPLIKLDDFIGDQLEKNEKFNPKDASTIKEIMINIGESGLDSITLYDKLRIALLMLKYKFNDTDLYNIYAKYVGNWGAESTSYKLVGYKNNEPVLTKVIGPSSAKGLIVECDSNQLHHDFTYDVTRIVVKCVDFNNNVLPYSNDCITINVEGPIELIGPSHLSLIGGSIGFWVKSISNNGLGKIVIKSERFGESKVEIEVTNK